LFIVYVTLPPGISPIAVGIINNNNNNNKHKTALATGPKHKMTPHRSKPPYLKVFPRITNMTYAPLRPIVSTADYPFYALVDFPHKILSSLSRKSESFVKNLSRFVQLLSL
jgi:hypothetical protein